MIAVITANILLAQTEPPRKNKVQYLHAVETKAGYGILVDDYGFFIRETNGTSSLAVFKQWWGVGIHELHGIQFNPHLALSGVIGLDFLKMYPDEQEFQANNPSFPLPYPDLYVMNFTLGLNFKYTILKKYKWSPFLTLEVCPIGAELTGLKHPTFYYRDWFRRGSASFSIGAQYRFKDRQNVYAALGYELAFSQLFLSVGVRLR